MRSSLTALVAGLLAMPAGSQPLPFEPAEPERYVIELLVFRHADAPVEIGEPAAAANEDEPGSSGRADDDAAGFPPPDDQGPISPAGTPDERAIEPALAYEPLADEALQLTELEAKMADSGEYEPLLHVGWIQEGFPAAGAPAFPVDRTWAGRPDLTGTVTFSHGRYPHLELNLRYRPEALARAHPGWDGFRINEYRRLREGEHHYFDNVGLGAIARVTPYVPEEPDGLEGPETPEDAAGVVEPAGVLFRK